jgi:hypothetical protein
MPPFPTLMRCPISSRQVDVAMLTSMAVK